MAICIFLSFRVSLVLGGMFLFSLINFKTMLCFTLVLPQGSFVVHNNILHTVFFLIRTSDRFGLTLNVLKLYFEDFPPKVFLNIIVSIGCAFTNFHSHKSTGRIYTLVN